MSHEINNSQQIISEPSKQFITEASDQTSVTAKQVRDLIEEAKPEILQNARIEAKSEIDKQMQNAQASFITIFGIFASVLSFLTIEFQFLKTLSHIEQIIGFSLLLFSLLLGFNIGLDYLVKSRLDKSFPCPHWLLLLLILGSGIGSYLTLYRHTEITYFPEKRSYDHYSSNNSCK